MALTLSEYLLRDFAVERVDAMLVDLCSGGVRFPAEQPAYFHLMLAGRAKLLHEASGESAELNTGDFALVLYGAGHVLACADVKRPRVASTFDNWKTGDEPFVLTVGTGLNPSRVLSGRLHLTRLLRSAPVNRALPHVLFYRACGTSEAAADTAPAPIFDDMAKVEAACRGRGASAFVITLVQSCFVQTLRGVHEDLRQMFPIQVGSPEAGRMAAVVRKLRAHPEKRWTVASLAQEVGCSRSSFAAKFQAYAGIGPIKFAARMRLNQAADILRANPELPLWEVAKRVGYDAQGSFTRAFKAQFGVSPRGYVDGMSRTRMPQDAVLDKPRKHHRQ